MRKRVQGAQDKGEHHDELLQFTLSPLLPANHILVLNPSMHTATLLNSEGSGEVHIVQQQHFSPNGMGVLVPLLQAYPHYCPYEVLLASLFPLSLEECREQLREAWEMALRPVRRAMSSIMAGLRALGLQVRSIRGAGYLIEAL
jgi:biotin operon repressor